MNDKDIKLRNIAFEIKIKNVPKQKTSMVKYWLKSGIQNQQPLQQNTEVMYYLHPFKLRYFGLEPLAISVVIVVKNSSTCSMVLQLGSEIFKIE